MSLTKIREITDFEKVLFLQKQNSEFRKLMIFQNKKMLELNAENLKLKNEQRGLKGRITSLISSKSILRQELKSHKNQ